MSNYWFAVSVTCVVIALLLGLFGVSGAQGAWIFAKAWLAIAIAAGVMAVMVCDA